MVRVLSRGWRPMSQWRKSTQSSRYRQVSHRYTMANSIPRVEDVGSENSGIIYLTPVESLPTSFDILFGAFFFRSI